MSVRTFPDVFELHRVVIGDNTPFEVTILLERRVDGYLYLVRRNAIGIVEKEYFRGDINLAYTHLGELVETAKNDFVQVFNIYEEE